VAEGAREAILVSDDAGGGSYLIFGATGMVGQGVLRECLLDPGVRRVVAVGRSGTGETHPKLRELIVPDLMDLSPVTSELVGFDACFFCVGVTSAGLSEADYSRLTYDLTLAVATALVGRSPGLTFVFVSGQGADSSERGRVMWARVKGRTENALRRLPFRAVYVFRPGYIQPLHGIRSRTRWYRLFYRAMAPLYPFFRVVFPGSVTTTEQLGRAMLAVARRGYERPVLTSRDLNRL
jgi:uncharacterized protein YbjT (DUF2867 family)